MTDIVTRLREGVFNTEPRHDWRMVIHSHMQAAADEIERLREAQISERHGWQAEVERLRREVMRAGGAQ